MVCSREQLGSNIFGPGGIGGGFGSGGGFSGGGGGGNFRRFLVIDEPTLQAVADITGGSYFWAESADQLNEIFQELPTQIVLQKETQEISVIFVALGAILATIAVALSLLWNRFP
jgi:Ca-activated chloride channel family protein